MLTPDCSPDFPQVKTCRKCGLDLPIDRFGKHKGRPLGVRNVCKGCRPAESRAYYMANRDKIAVSKKAYVEKNRAEISEARARKWAENRDAHKARRAANRERAAQTARAYRLANAERVREYNREWRANHPGYGAEWQRANADRMKGYYRAFRERHRESISKTRRAYREANADRIKAEIRAWRKANAARIREYNAIQRLQRMGRPGVCSLAQLRARWEVWGGLCWMCGAVATATDHVIALSRGGTNWPANLRPACKSCNSRKKDKDWRAFVSPAG